MVNADRCGTMGNMVGSTTELALEKTLISPLIRAKAGRMSNGGRTPEMRENSISIIPALRPTPIRTDILPSMRMVAQGTWKRSTRHPSSIMTNPTSKRSEI